MSSGFVADELLLFSWLLLPIGAYGWSALALAASSSILFANLAGGFFKGFLGYFSNYPSYGNYVNSNFLFPPIGRSSNEFVATGLAIGTYPFKSFIDCKRLL